MYWENDSKDFMLYIPNEKHSSAWSTFAAHFLDNREASSHEAFIAKKRYCCPLCHNYFFNLPKHLGRKKACKPH
jgi:hypothetical protein